MIPFTGSSDEFLREKNLLYSSIVPMPKFYDSDAAIGSKSNQSPSHKLSQKPHLFMQAIANEFRGARTAKISCKKVSAHQQKGTNFHRTIASAISIENSEKHFKRSKDQLIQLQLGLPVCFAFSLQKTG